MDGAWPRGVMVGDGRRSLPFASDGQLLPKQLVQDRVAQLAAAQRHRDQANRRRRRVGFFAAFEAADCSRAEAGVTSQFALRQPSRLAEADERGAVERHRTHTSSSRSAGATRITR